MTTSAMQRAAKQEGFERNLAARDAAFLNPDHIVMNLRKTEMALAQHTHLFNRLQDKNLLAGLRDFWQQELDEMSIRLNQLLDQCAAPMPLAPSVAQLRECDRALLMAASKGDLSAAQQALTEGADINAKNAASLTALGVAATRGDESMFNALWALEARLLWEEDNRIRPAITIAAEQGRDVAVKLLLRAGADPNTKSASGDSTLTWAKGRKTRALLKKAGAVKIP